ncbi:CAP domain-containing protein [Patescibacteria group bacterium]|nr:CAP domain-containing protein [Patescibacteria group bacterium]MCL5010158.1 CAP domain-containing protein [Patescibacteria group bacterium]
MRAFFCHFFTPQKSNNHRAKLLHSFSLFIFAAFLFAGSFLIDIARVHTPQVLGDSIDISSNQLLLLTNSKRLKNGVLPLRLNAQLEAAADSKAKDMFAKDYWAHNGPDGETPWMFIKKAGYDYTYAGENLARGFTSSEGVINAWMASPEHRANMLSGNYQDVGFAVENGTLGGERTVLVVEMFGGKDLGVPALGHKEKSVASASKNNNQPRSPQRIIAQRVFVSSLFDSKILTKSIVFLILSVFIVVLFLDLVLARRMDITRFVGHNIDHMLFFGLLVIMVFVISRAVIL